MPEGVEVKLQIEKLKKLKNQEIQSVKILSGRYSRHGHPKGFISFKKALPLVIQSIHNKGKFIYFMLSNNWIIMITLGMTGKLKIRKEHQKHDHIQFLISKYTLYFNDLRNFGTIELTNDKNVLENKLNRLGYDPLQENIGFPQFLAHIGKFKQELEIAELLLNQKFISGIGNYLRSDILYCSKINPKSKIKDLSTNTLEKLLKCIIKTMHESYSKQKQKNHKFLIYKQKISPIGNPVKKYKDTKGRMVWYDEKVQIL